MFRPILFAAFAQILLLAPCSARQKFAPACSTPTFPSPAPAKALAIDSSCGTTGSGGDESNQNAAKNNFCATGTPQPMTIAEMAQLQMQVAKDPSIDFGDESDPPRTKGPQVDRAPLQALGEGNLVSVLAYVLFARQEGAESVNCEKNVPDQPAYHDIHIELVDSPSTADECAGVVAEMIPHHRPSVWTADNVSKVSTAKLMVRVTGQLFFDSSHFPCQNDQGLRENPRRASLWEIHPIYKFEVCSEGTCTATSGTWVPLDQWLKTPAAKKIKPPSKATSPQ